MCFIDGQTLVAKNAEAVTRRGGDIGASRQTCHIARWSIAAAACWIVGFKLCRHYCHGRQGRPRNPRASPPEAANPGVRQAAVAHVARRGSWEGSNQPFESTWRTALQHVWGASLLTGHHIGEHVACGGHGGRTNMEDQEEDALPPLDELRELIDVVADRRQEVVEVCVKP